MDRREGAQSDADQSSTEASSDYFVSAPSLSLPTGGGAITSIGEKFSANPVTGTGSMSVPIATSPGRGGFGPQLALSYDSGAGNGPFGFGWNLSVPAITRKTQKGLPRYLDAEESDTFILSGTEELVPTLVTEDGQWQPEVVKPRIVGGKTYQIQRYRPRVEGLFARIERWTNQADSQETFWRSISRDNVTTWYGREADSRIADPADPARIFSWLICESYDDKGNVMVYRYKAEDSAQVEARTDAHEVNRTVESRSANRYLKQILYGNEAPYLPELVAGQPWPAPSGSWFFEVLFDYGEHLVDAPWDLTNLREWARREDPFSSYRAGFEVRTYRLCQRVLMFHHFEETQAGAGYDGLVRSTDFHYSYEENPSAVKDPIYSKLLSVTHKGYQKGSGGCSRSKPLPPVEFTYSEPTIDDRVRTVDQISLENLPEGLDGSRYQWVDLDGEGLSGVLTEQGSGWFYKRNFSPVNLQGEEGSEHVQARFAGIEQVASQPAMALASGARFLDLAGDGRPDVVAFQGSTPGFYERTMNEDWEQFQSFQSLPNIDWQNPNLRFIDLDGDGHSDVLITEENCFVWHRSLAEGGFESAVWEQQPWDEEQGPRIVFADGTQSIYLSDMSGDGLTDIVRIRNGELCYWPNLGYGRFGAKVSMDNAPWFDAVDIFDQRRLVLADIDGTGTTDLLYLSGTGVQIYFNQSGNSWSQRQRLSSFPAIDSVAGVTAIDLLGNGTACLVWSSSLPNETGRTMRYIELMGGLQRFVGIDGTDYQLRGHKPHLLVHSHNNLGAETLVQYAPSTKFYLQDKLAGRPWITKLPFPVQVVEKVTVKDKWRHTAFSTTYSYHHGYFDGTEREFRGFGRVEQTDVEDFGQFAAENGSSPYITNDQTLYQPPVKTISWFHTGAFFERDRILSQFEQEYFPRWFEALNPDATNVLGTFQENALPEPDLVSQELTAMEWREALRACKGMPLRQEVYELDVDALARGEERRVKLFSTAFHNCHIQLLQPQLDNHHGVFLVTESEALSYQYELDLRPTTLEPDPRISHTLNLRIDEYGQVLQSVAIAYPRLEGTVETSLPEGSSELIKQVQTETHLVYTETRYTNDVNDSESDQYRLRLPCEVLTYELTDIGPEDEAEHATFDLRDNRYFSLKELRRYRLSEFYEPEDDSDPNLWSVAELFYHQVPTRTTPEKRLVERVRMLFFEETLQAALPFGQLNGLGLPYETYTLALTDDLLDAIFKAEQLTPEVRNDLNNARISGYLSGANLAQRFEEPTGRFPVLDTQGQYWVRSGVAGFSEDAADHFYLPEQYTDPFGAVTRVSYDSRDLYITSSRDPIGNTTQVLRFDFRVMAPTGLEDINRNRSEVYFDVLGMPAAMAVRGKGNEGDSLNGLEDEVVNPSPAELAAFFGGETYDEAPARRWLSSATARHIYHFGETVQLDGDTTVTTWGAEPAAACSITRERHVVALDPGEVSPLQVGFEYSDGMGSVLVTKNQAEPERDANSDNRPLRWIANGRTILNNKGNPVKQYEPYFSDHHRWDLDEEQAAQEESVTAVLYYDAAGRQVRTEMPDGTYSRVAFSPWFMAAWDASDTVGESSGNTWYSRYASGSVEEQRAARLALVHADTPAVTHLDSLGREVVAIAHNKWRRGEVETEEKYVTYTKLDIESKPLWIRDARGNRVMEYINRPGATTDFVPCYDIAGNLLYQHSMDAGDRWMLMDSTGQPFYAWDENERVLEDGSLTSLEQRQFHTTYDALRRPVEQQLKVDDGSQQVVERFEYGEGQPDDVGRNLRGQVYQHYDSSGVITNQGFDFKGNLLEATRQLTQTYDQAVIDWRVEVPSAEVFTQRTEYDALNRMARLENWHRAERSDRPPAIYVPTYNRQGVLKGERLTVHGRETEAIEEITYNAKGQRLSIRYGNETTTAYTYDEKTFRLTRLRTTRTGRGRVYQDLQYTYDPVGNITSLRDDAQQTVYFDNTRIEPHCQYVYDALYRLIRAEGREHARQNNVQRDNTPFEAETVIPFPNSPEALQRYVEEYQYDSVGNILSFAHRGGAVDRWRRCYEYALDSNRLLATGGAGEVATDASCPQHYVVTPSLSQRHDYDTHGNMLNLYRSRERYHLRWDYRDMIFTVDLVGGGQAFYSYASDKQRTRKRINRNGSRVEERLYLGGMELYRRWDGNGLVEEIETHHLFADNQRILIVEDVLETDNTSLPIRDLYRYQYSNHLGSVGLELDQNSEVISYEEYHPYGTTAYQARNREIRTVSNRFLYTGMERDEETGLSYHTARYYISWLGKWLNIDPIGLEGGLNLYFYASGNPQKFIDKTGKQATPTPEELAQNMSIEPSSAAASPPPDSPAISHSPPSTKKGVRRAGNRGARKVRKVQNMTDPVVQAGHTRAVRHALESGISMSDLNEPESFQHLHSKLGQGLDVEVTDQDGTIKTTTRHRAQEQIIDQNVHTVRKATGKPLTPEGQMVAGDQVLWQTQGTGLDQREVAEKRASGLVDESNVMEQRSSAQSHRNRKVKRVPNRRVRGGGILGKIISVGVAGYVLYDTGDVAAAAQTANPVANTTKSVLAEEVTASSVRSGLLRDAYEASPLSFYEYVKPQGENVYDSNLSERAIQEGRNPFCAQCHGPGGALDPGNERNPRNRFGSFPESDQSSDFNREALLQFIRQQPQ